MFKFNPFARSSKPERQGRSLREVLVNRGSTLILLFTVAVCSSCTHMQVRPQTQRQVQFCQGPTVEASLCSPADIRALERAIFGLPGQRR
jgi:hypothetical protein